MKIKSGYARIQDAIKLQRNRQYTAALTLLKAVQREYPGMHPQSARNLAAKIAEVEAELATKAGK